MEMRGIALDGAVLVKAWWRVWHLAALMQTGALEISTLGCSREGHHPPSLVVDTT
jgi:hypothetical protein